MDKEPSDVAIKTRTDGPDVSPPGVTDRETREPPTLAEKEAWIRKMSPEGFKAYHVLPSEGGAGNKICFTEDGVLRLSKIETIVDGLPLTINSAACLGIALERDPGIGRFFPRILAVGSGFVFDTPEEKFTAINQYIPGLPLGKARRYDCHVVLVEDMKKPGWKVIHDLDEVIGYYDPKSASITAGRIANFFRVVRISAQMLLEIQKQGLQFGDFKKSFAVRANGENIEELKFLDIDGVSNRDDASTRLIARDVFGGASPNVYFGFPESYLRGDEVNSPGLNGPQFRSLLWVYDKFLPGEGKEPLSLDELVEISEEVISNYETGKGGDAYRRTLSPKDFLRRNPQI